jgi:hypothetical protein
VALKNVASRPPLDRLEAGTLMVGEEGAGLGMVDSLKPTLKAGLQTLLGPTPHTVDFRFAGTQILA